MKFRRLLDALSVYLPMIVLALLALGSWWLVRSMPTIASPAALKVARQAPDYRLADFSVKTFDASGRMTREVTGEAAQHYPASQELHIEQVRIFAQDEKGQRMNAQATQGIATDDGKQVTLIGDAYAIRHPQANSAKVELSGQRLVALTEEDRVVSTDPVQITRDRDVFTAETMNFNSSTGEYELQGRVRGNLAPKSSKP